MVFYDHLASFLLYLVKELLGMTPDLSTRPSLYEFLNLLPVLSIDS